MFVGRFMGRELTLNRHLIRASNLPPYLPLASRVKPLQFNNFERQVVFLPAPPLSIETHAYENE
jgi:hypothetical protein